MDNGTYEKLAGQLGFPGSERFFALLSYLMTPEQAAVAAALPGGAEEVAAKTGLDAETVAINLEDLFERGIIFPRGDLVKRVNYKFARDIIQLHDATQASKHLDPVRDRQLFELWHDFCINEKYSFIAAFAVNLPQAFARVIPAYHAVKDLPGVQPWENFREILQAQETIAVVPCSCRLRTTAVGEDCGYAAETEDWKCLQFGRGANYVISRDSGREITLEEAVALADRAEEDGLVHIGGYDNSMFFNTSCQCCKDCCEIFVALNSHQVNMGQIYAKSRYTAAVAAEDCSGCRKCVERCQFDAIEMVNSGKEAAAVVDEEKCWGCGVCVLKCKTEAIRLKAIRPPEFIPQAAG